MTKNLVIVSTGSMAYHGEIVEVDAEALTIVTGTSKVRATTKQRVPLERIKFVIPKKAA